MTRSFRAIRFPRVLFIILSIFTAGAGFAQPVQAAADQPDTATPAKTVSEAVIGADTSIDQGDGKIAPESLMTAPQAASLSNVVESDPPPSVETPLHRLYCVEYARIRSGFQIFGNAKTWWQKAKNLYAEATEPAADTVMVFAGSQRIRLGHVAVVTKLVGPREIRVDQANWENHGEIDHNTPVLDVSPDNDWSQVRVWDIRSGQFGGHIYAIKGFIARMFPIPQGS